jgi:hypothetical protein
MYIDEPATLVAVDTHTLCVCVCELMMMMMPCFFFPSCFIVVVEDQTFSPFLIFVFGC